MNPILHKEQRTTESLFNNDNNLTEWMKISIVPSDLDIDNVPKTTILAIFSEAEILLSEKGATTKAASTDERLRNVKGTTSVQSFSSNNNNNTPSNRNRHTCRDRDRDTEIPVNVKLLFGTVFVPIQLLWHVNWIFGLMTLWRFEKNIETMLGKKMFVRSN